MNYSVLVTIVCYIRFAYQISLYNLQIASYSPYNKKTKDASCSFTFYFIGLRFKQPFTDILLQNILVHLLNFGCSAHNLFRTERFKLYMTKKGPYNGAL